MDTSNLTDRYVSAAMRTVPEDQRADLSAELRASIDDQIDARIAAGEPADAAERDVLTDLGDPDKLAAGYTDRPLWLIGPAYFLTWWRLLKLLLWIVVPLAGVGVALGQALSGAGIGEIIGTAVVVVLHTIVHIAFWTTLVFAIVERASQGDPRGTVPKWTLDDLPEPHESGAKLSDLVASLVFLAAAAGAVLWDHFVGVVYTVSGGGWMPFLSPDLWPWWIAGLFAVIALEAALAIVVYAAGRWTMPFAIMNGILNLVFAVPAIWLLATGRLLNPAFWPTLIPEGDSATVANVVTIVLGFGIAGVAVWDTIDAALKARRSARR